MEFSQNAFWHRVGLKRSLMIRQGNSPCEPWLYCRHIANGSAPCDRISIGFSQADRQPPWRWYSLPSEINAKDRGCGQSIVLIRHGSHVLLPPKTTRIIIKTLPVDYLYLKTKVFRQLLPTEDYLGFKERIVNCLPWIHTHKRMFDCRGMQSKWPAYHYAIIADPQTSYFFT